MLQNIFTVYDTLYYAVVNTWHGLLCLSSIRIPKDSLALCSPAGKTFVRFTLLLLTSWRKLNFVLRRERNILPITQNPFIKTLNHFSYIEKCIRSNFLGVT